MTKLAIIGATGLVGQKLIKVLEERKFPVTELIPVASEASKGSNIKFNQQSIALVSLQDALDRSPDIVLFAASGKVSKEYAKQFVERGAYVIDNSSEFRMDPTVPLVVPEINQHSIEAKHRLISNPNCSTIQLVMALCPLHAAYGIKRIVISTYQSVTGTGAAAVKQLENERVGISSDSVYPHPIDLNCFPHGGDFDENGDSTEELKLVNETQKILGDQNIKVSATVVRIPVLGGHSESVNVEFEKPFDLPTAKQLMADFPGIEILDDPSSGGYPTPQMAHESDSVFVGRVRRDSSVDNGLSLWIVSDNLRKGAATNAVQIAELLV